MESSQCLSPDLLKGQTDNLSMATAVLIGLRAPIPWCQTITLTGQDLGLWHRQAMVLVFPPQNGDLPCPKACRLMGPTYHITESLMRNWLLSSCRGARHAWRNWGNSTGCWWPMSGETAPAWLTTTISPWHRTHRLVCRPWMTLCTVDHTWGQHLAPRCRQWVILAHPWGQVTLITWVATMDLWQEVQCHRWALEDQCILRCLVLGQWTWECTLDLIPDHTWCRLNHHLPTHLRCLSPHPILLVPAKPRRGRAAHNHRHLRHHWASLWSHQSTSR